MAKTQLRRVENLDAWSVSSDMSKGMSKAHVAAMNTDEVFRI